MGGTFDYSVSPDLLREGSEWTWSLTIVVRFLYTIIANVTLVCDDHKNVKIVEKCLLVAKGLRFLTRDLW